MGGELIGKSANLAPPMALGWPVSENGPMPAPDAAGREVNVDDGVDLVGALRRLIDALRETSDDTLCSPKNSKKRASRPDRAPSRRGRRHVRGDFTRTRQRLDKAAGVRAM